jgi:O-antigen/teichoic acid export membrane protein
VKSDPTSLNTVIKSEAKVASIYTISTFLTQVGSFLIVPFFWQKLSISDYGIIGIVEIIGSFLGMFLALQLDISITRFYYEWAPEERKWRVGNIWIFSSICIFVLGSFSLLILYFISDLLFRDVPFFPFIFLGLIGFLISRLTIVPFATLRIINNAYLFASLSVVTFFIQSGLNIYYVLILNYGLNGYFVSNIIGNLISLFLITIFMFKIAKPCLKFKPLVEALKFSLPQIPASTISGLTGLMDRYLLQRYASLEVVGVYSICLKFTNLVLHVHNSIKISFIPFMVKAIAKDRNEGIHLISRMQLFYLFPILIFGLAINLFIKDFVIWVNREDYFPIIDWIGWLILPSIISTFSIYLAPGLFLSKRSDLTWIPAAVQLTIVVVFGLLFIPTLQMTGVVISRYASVISLFLTMLWLSNKQYFIPINWLKIHWILALFIFISLVSAWWNTDDWLLSLLFHVFFIVVFIAIGSVSLFGIKKSKTFFLRRNLESL